MDIDRYDHLARAAGEERRISWSSDVAGKWDRFSRGWCDFTGRTLGQERDDGWLEGMHPEAFRGRAPFEMGVRLLHRDETWHRIQVHGSPSFDAAGTFMGFAGCCEVNDGLAVEVTSSSGEGPFPCLP